MMRLSVRLRLSALAEKQKKYTKPSLKISTMNPVGFYGSPSGEKLVQRKDIRDQYSYRRGSRFLRRSPATGVVAQLGEYLFRKNRRSEVRILLTPINVPDA